MRSRLRARARRPAALRKRRGGPVPRPRREGRRGWRASAGDETEAGGRGGGVNGSGGWLPLRAAWHMDAGAPPRGWRGRVLWLVTVEVSCRVDPVLVSWAGVGGGVLRVWWILGRNAREIPVRWPDSVRIGVRLLFWRVIRWIWLGIA